MGAVSPVAFSAVSENVKVQLRRSKPYFVTDPFVTIGAGRTKASAARNPEFEESSADFWEGEGLEEMEGVLSVAEIFAGLAARLVVEERDCEYEGEPRSKEMVDSLGF